MSAPKVWLSYNDLLARLRTNGMDIGDQKAGLATLKRIGYYRLSGYTYPYRSVDRDGNVLDTFSHETTLFEVTQLYRFDEKLRSLVLDGLQTIEIAFGAHIAHHLGKLDPFGHLGTEHLNTYLCERKARVGDEDDSASNHEAWIARYSALMPKAEHEDYIRHHQTEYDGRIPIWAAVQFLDFGSLLKLYELMRKDERNKVTRELGIKKPAPDLTHKWLLSMSVLRNHCAHGNRVWNRSVYRPIGKPSPDFVDESLHHLCDLDDLSLSRIYPLLAYIAYVNSAIKPDSDWANSLRTHIRKLEKQTRFSPQRNMGFPANWEHLTLWGGSETSL